MTKSPSDNLIAALNLIEDGKHWGRGAYHKKSGIWPFRRDKYCALGALRAGEVKGIGIVMEPEERAKEQTYLARAAKELFNACIIGVNDVHGHEATVEMFKHAIKLANQDEKKV